MSPFPCAPLQGEKQNRDLEKLTISLNSNDATVPTEDASKCVTMHLSKNKDANNEICNS